MVAEPDAALKDFLGLLHMPLAKFLGGTQNALDPTAVLAVADQLWMNINRPGDINTRHDHGSPTCSLVASGVYYPASSGAALGSLRLFPDAGPLEVTPEGGLLLLFSPDLQHEVSPTPPGAPERISVAFNLRVRWLSSPLLRAAALGEGGPFERLVGEERAVAFEADGQLGLAPLHLAAEAGHLEVASSLVRLRADPGQASFEGWTPLGLAAERGHLKLVEYLVEQEGALLQAERPGVDGSPSSWIWRDGLCGVPGALALAAERGHQGVLDCLLSLPGAGAPGAAAVEDVASAGALQRAAAAGQTAAVSLLLLRRADPQFPSPSGARTALHEAAGAGHAAVVSLLLAARADPGARDEDEATPLHDAAAKGHLPAVQALLAEAAGAGLDLAATDREGAQAMHWAARRGHCEVLAALASAGADPCGNGDHVWPSPLHWAAAAGHAAVVRQLLALGAAPLAGGRARLEPAASSLPRGPLMRRGTFWERERFAAYVARKTAGAVSCEAAGESGGSAAHSAAQAGHVEVLEALAAADALPAADVLDVGGGTPLHWAAANGHSAAVAWLLGRGTDCRAPDAAGGEPLHDAVWGGHVEVIDMLLRARADPDAEDRARLSPLGAATWLGAGAEELQERLRHKR